jgi:hypothetical protein
MIAKCPCDHCGKNIEFATEEFLSGSGVACPHCGRETVLSVSPQTKQDATLRAMVLPSTTPMIPPSQRFTTSARSKIPTSVWIGIGVTILCALCFASILIGKNLQKHSGQTSEASPKNNLIKIFQNLKANNAAIKKPDFPPPPTSGVEFSAKLLKNFPERVNRQQGWMDAKFYEIDNSPIDELMGDGYTSIDASFTVEDKNGDLFQNCLVKKDKFGDQLLQLKDGDYIRITGQAVSMATSELWINIDSIQVIR